MSSFPEQTGSGGGEVSFLSAIVLLLLLLAGTHVHHDWGLCNHFGL